LFGNQVHRGDFHHTGFTETTLRVHLIAAGLDVETIYEHSDWLLSAHARKLTGWDDFLPDVANLDNEKFVQHIFRRAFGHEPEEATQGFLLHHLNKKTMTRRQAAKHLFEAPDRLLSSARRAGL
jgi:hypothetical protein